MMRSIFYVVMLCLLFGCKSREVRSSEFEIREGFKMELIAVEPTITDPVDLEFDEWGQLFVLEMPGYPFEDKQSRVVRIVDEDKDGHYEKAVVFADSLQLATSILPYEGGLLVAAPPYLLHITDTDGDQVADRRDTLLGGFNTGNLQHNYNGLTYGIDGWVYAANGGNSGTPYWWSSGEMKPFDIRDDDFRINIKDRNIERIGLSSGGFGLGLDEWGRLYETHNLEHVSQLVYPGRYTSSYDLSLDPSLTNISDHEENGLSRIYPIGEQESRVNHPEQSGYFSGACGITYYGGGNFGEEYQNTLWIADVVLNLVHVDKLSDNGSTQRATRLLENSDFLASSDRAFRPVNMSVGPDGAIYLLDMHRAVIEHPEWIPDEIESTLNIHEGKEKGRIYKISRVDRPSSIEDNIDKLSLTSISGQIEALGHPNQWVRMTAHRLLAGTENLQPAALARLAANLVDGSDFEKLHSLWLLSLRNQLTSEQWEVAMQSNRPELRENALIVSEKMADRAGLYPYLLKALTDTNQRVRLQAALTISTMDEGVISKDRDTLLEAFIAASQMDMDKWNYHAITIAAHKMTKELLSRLLQINEVNQHPVFLKLLASSASLNKSDLQRLLQDLATSKLSMDNISLVLNAIAEHNTTQMSSAEIVRWIEHLERLDEAKLIASCTKLRLSLGMSASSKFIQNSVKSLTLVAEDSAPLESRLKQMSIIELLPFEQKSHVLYTLLTNTQPMAIQEAAMSQLMQAKHPETGTRLVKIWKNLGPQSRRTASDLLLYDKHYHDALLTGLENGTINIGEMNFDLERRRTLLRWTDDKRTIARAEALFSDAGVVNRAEIIERMKPALSLASSPIRGEEVFTMVCGQCHMYKEIGKNVGPVLTEIGRKSKATLLHDILDPNAAVDTRYINHRLETNDGTIHVGIVDSETDHEISIKKMGGMKVTVSKKEIKELMSLGSSMMLEGLENSMSQQDLADLLAFLQD